MTKTVVVYHSGYGHTQRLAQFVAQGAKATIIEINAEAVSAKKIGPRLTQQMRLFLVHPPTWAWPHGNSKNLQMRHPSVGTPVHGKIKWRVVSPYRLI